MSKLNLIYICSARHSGSTLLDLVLGSHTKMESLGEAHRFVDYTGSCTCGVPIEACKYWQRVRRRLEETDYQGMRRYSFRLTAKLLFHLRGKVHLTSSRIMQYSSANYRLFEAARAISGKEFVVDSSKLIKRLAIFDASGLFNIKAIYLIREPCGFLYSQKKRKFGSVERARILESGEYEFDFEKRFLDGQLKANLLWYLNNLSIFRYFKKMAFENAIVVRYEDLCTNPQNELRKLCGFIGVPFEEEMLDYGDRVHHNVGGNPMRNNAIKRRGIKYDDKWKDKLSGTELMFCQFFKRRMDNRLETSEDVHQPSPGRGPCIQG